MLSLPAWEQSLPVAWRWGVRSLLAGLTLWAGLGSPSARLLEALVPAQAWVHARLMPEHRVERFGLLMQRAQLSLAVRSQSTEHLIVRGKAYPPPVDFEASTPARAPLLIVMVVLLGGLLGIRAQPGWSLALAALGLLMAFVLAVAIPALVLAGAQWGLAYEAFEELSLATLLVAASNFLLHGGALALGIAAVLGLRVVAAKGLGSKTTKAQSKS